MTRLRQSLGSIAFTSYLFLSVPFYSIAAFAAAPFSRFASYRIAVAWAASVLFWLKTLCRLDFKVEGREHLGGENCVVLLKHSSAWETIAQFVIFPRQTWVMKRELLWVPILGWVLLLFRPIAIDRKGGRAAVEEVLAQGRARLEQGYWVMIFPEGTRVAVGEQRRYGLSGALLAELSGRAVIPVAHNAGVFWPRRVWLKRPGTISLIIGPRIETRGRDARSVNSQVQEWIESRQKAFDPPA
ncbi:MAG TPA: lysophospholipid acyltransferase family protein [Gammaproteobacteria bacterium]|jgi:1-acyl-sn-glycerol-3-phosphate acyltransferase